MNPYKEYLIVDRNDGTFGVTRHDDKGYKSREYTRKGLFNLLRNNQDAALIFSSDNVESIVLDANKPKKGSISQLL